VRLECARVILSVMVAQSQSEPSGFRWAARIRERIVHRLQVDVLIERILPHVLGDNAPVAEADPHLMIGRGVIGRIGAPN